MSYRIRGSEARVNRKKRKKHVVAIIIIKKFNSLKNEKALHSKPAEIREIIKILVYSAIKIMANSALPYSVLNPETSSDSPSAKSKGVRFASAKMVNLHKIMIIGCIANARKEDVSEECQKSKCLAINKKDKMIKTILISYEMVWATPRRAPNIEYLAFDAHPDKNTG